MKLSLRELRDSRTSRSHFAESKKALAPIARPRARFSYDDLQFYVVRWNGDALVSFRAGADPRLLLPEVAFFVPRLEHCAVLNHHA